MKLLASLLVVLLSMAWTAGAQEQPPAPTVLGLDHVAVQSTDVPASVAFYCELLGFAELGRKNLTGDVGKLQFVYLKINENQRFKIFDATHLNPNEDLLYQIALRV
jgi:catechol 2,3-dioxygenase-like lactoylglutathione lyase family enzyme